VDLYSAFIVVPHTQGVQVQITQQITLHLPLPWKRSPDAPPLTEVSDIYNCNCSLRLIYQPWNNENWDSLVVDLYSGWFTHIMVTSQQHVCAGQGKVRPSKIDGLPLP